MNRMLHQDPGRFASGTVRPAARFAPEAGGQAGDAPLTPPAGRA